MYILTNISQINTKEFKIGHDDVKIGPVVGMLIILHKPFIEVKIRGVETSDSFYEAVVSIGNYESYAAVTKKIPEFNKRPGRFGSEYMLQANFLHVKGMEMDDIEDDVSHCEYLKLV